MDKKNQMEAAIWAAKSLFDRNKLAGSSGNISFIQDDKIYISGSGTCFGCLDEASFAIVSKDGTVLNGVKPSKELPLHLAVYEKHPEMKAVIHTHSFYATLWSCLDNPSPQDCIPQYTPYLRMKVGSVGLIPYAPPGTAELFAAFRENMGEAGAFLLKNHGPVVPGKTVMDAFYNIEELEESAKIAYHLRGTDAAKIG